MLFDVGVETVLGRVRDVVVQGLGEELIGGGKVLFAVSEEDASPASQSGTRRLRHQRRLADAGLTEIKRTSRTWSPETRLLASAIACVSTSRPTTPTVGRTARRPGSGTETLDSAAPTGSQSTSTVSTGSDGP